MPVSRTEQWTLAGLFAAALAIGLLSAHDAFRSDEIWSLNAVSGSHAAMLATLRADIHPPLFYELLFAECLHWLFFVRRGPFRFGAILAASLAPYAVLWLPAFIRQMSKSQEALAWVTKPGAAEIGSTLFVYTGTLLIFAPFLVWM